MAITINELQELVDYGCSCVKLPNNIGDNAQELVELFREEFPFKIVDTIDGQCIKWDADFIDKVLVVMVTGSLEDMSDIEKQIWYQFVEFQDAMSHSALTTNVGAIGCTIPDGSGQSFVVTTNGITTELCQNPATSVAKERQSKSLDDYLMDLYNCVTPNDCGIITGEVADISPCLI